MNSFEDKIKMLDIHVGHGQRIRQRWDMFTSWYLGESIFMTGSSYGVNYSLSPQGTVNDSLGGEGEEFRLDTNYPYAFLDQMVSSVAPQNPKITLTSPVERLSKSASAREGLINSGFSRDQMFRKSWDISLFAGLCGIGFSKTTWDPIRKRPTETIINPRALFFDPTVPWEYTRYVIHAIPMTRNEFMSRTGDDTAENERFYVPRGHKVDFGVLPNWLTDPRTNRAVFSPASTEVFQWIVVYEFHDLQNKTMTMMLQDAQEPVWEGDLPFEFVDNCFSRLVFNNNTVDESGVSDVHLISQMQRRLNEIETLELMHAHASVPGAIIDENAFIDPTAATTRFRNSTGPGDYTSWKLRPEKSVHDAIMWQTPPGTVPGFESMSSRIRGKIEFTLGLADYQRGKTGTSDIATELALVDSHLKTRNSRRTVAINNWLVEVAKKHLGLYREYWPQAASATVRGRDQISWEIVDRLSLAFPEDMPPDQREDAAFDEEWHFLYEAVAYSPAENHKLVLLQKIVQMLEYFSQNPNIDQTQMTAWILELIGAPQLLQEAPPQQPQGEGQPPAPGQQPNQMPSGRPGDVVPTGGLPPQFKDQVSAIMPTRGMSASQEQ